MAAQVSCRPVYSYALSVLLVLLPGASQASPIMAPQDTRRGPGARGVLNTPLLEQEGDLDVQDLLGQFLSTFNLTELGPWPKPRASRKEPPEYMLELYNRFAHGQTTVPSANIIRSFKNEGTTFSFVTQVFLLLLGETTPEASSFIHYVDCKYDSYHKDILGFYLIQEN